MEVCRLQGRAGKLQPRAGSGIIGGIHRHGNLVIRYRIVINVIKVGEHVGCWMAFFHAFMLPQCAPPLLTPLHPPFQQCLERDLDVHPGGYYPALLLHHVPPCTTMPELLPRSSVQGGGEGKLAEGPQV